MDWRRLLAGLAVLTLAGAVLRNAAVSSWSATDPDAASRWWAGHPEVEDSLAQAAIGRAAASGREPGGEVFERLATVARGAPMAVSPLIVHAVAASQAGQAQRAQRLFAIAEQRRPREFAPHYFLAVAHLGAGRVEEGLRELVNLARLAPNGVTSAAPMVADFARQPSNWPRMRAVLDREPALERAVLEALARDPANVPTLLALARGPQRSPEAPWARISLAAHVDSGRYAEGRRLWAMLAGVREARDGLVYDPMFRDSKAPAPFNWELSETAVGSAERRPGGGLHVIFYGSNSGTLVRQLLLLSPGRYRLAIASDGKLAEPEALAWKLTCARPARDLLRVPAKTGGQSVSDVTIPGGCPAQWLSLEGQAQDIRGDSDIRIASVTISKVGA